MMEQKPDVNQINDGPPSIPPVTNQQRESGAEATALFEKKQYGQCLGILNKLVNQRSTDPKVLHNKGVAEIYQSGLRATDEYSQCLAKICHMAHINPENSESLEDVDHSIIYYNQAVVMYHLKQYRMALSILDKLFQYVEPLDEILSRNVLQLLAELYLCTYQPESAMGVLTYMEKLYLNGKGSSDKHEKGDNSNSNSREGSADDTAGSESWRSRLSVYKTRCFLMMKSLKTCKREIKSLINVQGMNTSVQYLKSYYEYLRGNYRKAMKMLGAVPQEQITSCGECPSVMHYNNYGCIHFQMKKPHLGAFYFRKALVENEAIVNEHLKKDTGKLSGKPLPYMGMSQHYPLLYNMGIQLLHCGKPLAAFDCLIEAVQMYHINPRLWLRLAECCIMVQRENNEADRQIDRRLDVIQGSVGSGLHRKLILGPPEKGQREINTTPAMPAATLEFAVFCLRNSLLLLPDNPSNMESNNSDDADSGKSGADPPLVLAPPASPMRPVEVANLRCSVLAAFAYVALSLNDYITALHQAEALLKQPRLSGAQRYLGHLYKAEALMSLDRIADAVQHLNPDNIHDISTNPPEMRTDQEKFDKPEKTDKDKNDKDAFEQSEIKVLYPWSPRDLQKARAIMQYNLATAHAIRGEYDKAMANLGESSKFIGTPLPCQMYLLKLFLDLIEGRRKLAQVLIKEHFGHVTPNRIEFKNSKPGGWNEAPPQ